MKNEHDSPENVEQRLQRFYQKKAEELKAPSDLWAKLEPRLDDPKKTASSGHQNKRRSHWLAGPRLVGVASALAVVLLLLVTGLVWWTGDNGKGNPSTNHSDNFALSASSSTKQQPSYEDQAVSGGSVVPSELPVPSPAAPAEYNGYYNDQIITNNSSTGNAGGTGATGAAGPSGVSYDANLPNAGLDQAVSLLDTAQRQVISTASISLEVQTVDTSISQIRGIAESMGGFLQQMSSTGGKDTEQSTVTIRVPQGQFFATLDRLEALGKVLSQNVGSQDVTEQYIDLNARLKSAQEEEQSLLSLLSKTATLADVISLEKELTQVRSNIENIQGQLNYIERRVDLATIDVSLSTPAKEVGQPPSGSITIKVHNVGNTIASVKGLVSSVNGEMGQVNISVNEGKETASLSFQLYRADFDQVMASIERQGKTQQKYIQEGTTPKGAQLEPSEKPDAYMSLTLIETGTHGFWTSTNIKVISISGSIVLVALLGFLYLAYRAGLLRKRPA